MAIKICQDKESGKKESGTPEWTRYPVIKIVVIIWGWIVGYDWRPIITVIFINLVRAVLIVVIRYLVLS